MSPEPVGPGNGGARDRYWLEKAIDDHTERLARIEDRLGQLWGWRVVVPPLVAALAGAYFGWVAHPDPGVINEDTVRAVERIIEKKMADFPSRTGRNK